MFSKKVTMKKERDFEIPVRTEDELWIQDVDLL